MSTAANSELPNATAIKGPLAGIKVLELSHYIAGPHCAMILADHGADVVKVEPPEGEPGRVAPPFSNAGESLYFASHNRGKRSVAIDLRHPRAKEALDPLLRWADVVVTNHVAGVLERLGFDFERLHRLNPRAILVHLTGYGGSGPFSDYVAFDGAIQAMSGFSSMTGDKDGPALLSQVLVADHTTGAHGAAAAMAALIERQQSGKGRLVEVTMTNAMISMLAHFVGAAGHLGEEPTRQGSRSATRFVNVLSASDAGVYLAPITPAMWRAFCDIIGHPEWGEFSDHEVYSDADLRATIEARAIAWMQNRTAAEAMAILQSRGIACGAVRTVAQIVREEIKEPTNALAWVDLPSLEKVPVPGPSFRFSDDPSPDRTVPALGADTDAVLARVGIEERQIADLVHAGVVAGANP